MLLGRRASSARVIKFIPHPVVTGFTTGIARDHRLERDPGLLRPADGRRCPRTSSRSCRRYCERDWHDEPVGGRRLPRSRSLLIVVWPPLEPADPGPVRRARRHRRPSCTLFDLPVETIGSRFGEIDLGVPPPGDAASVSIRGAARARRPGVHDRAARRHRVAAVGRGGRRHDRRAPPIEHGAGGAGRREHRVAACSAAFPRRARSRARPRTSRTAAARRSPAWSTRSRCSLITLVFGKWAALIPMAALAGDPDGRRVPHERVATLPRRAARRRVSDVAVLVTTFLLTVARRSHRGDRGRDGARRLPVHEADGGSDEHLARSRASCVATATTRPTASRARSAAAPFPIGVEVFEISGAFFFGAAEAFKEALGQIAGRPWVIIIRMRDVALIDSSGLHALTEVVRRFRRDRTVVLLAEVHAQPLAVIEASELFAEMGEDVFMNIDDALDRARAHVATRTTGSQPTPTLSQ